MVVTRSRKRSHASAVEEQNDGKKGSKTNKDDDVLKKKKSTKSSTRDTTRTPVKEETTAGVKSEMNLVKTLKDEDVSKLVDKLLKEVGIEETKTRNGWCLKEAMIHTLKAENGRMVPLFEQHGAPKIFATLQHCKNSTGVATEMATEPKNCFESLCRIVAGQQLTGAVASIMWKRLLKTCDGVLTPQKVLRLVKKGGMEEGLRKPAGISNAKARSIINLAEAFDTKELSEDFLQNSEEKEIRDALIKIWGIGPWSCDMFLMFFLELPDVFPIGDLGVRNGMKKVFDLKGSGKNGSLCHKKDLEQMESALAPFEPYRSVIVSYMWKVTDTKDVYHKDKGGGKSAKKRKK